MTNRGTAYIVYHDTADAEAAIAHMHEAQLDGAVITVSIVLPRRKFSPSPPSRRAPPAFDRFDSRGGPPGGYRGPPPEVIFIKVAIEITAPATRQLSEERKSTEGWREEAAEPQLQQL
ncbi:hypothetical protein H2201_006203 [Coniosporium apollinis]|uniref:RRM domain-containing protein n=1 Tax=Coniosporium apollinis TaxID=61459 RepID=A0ABQ9NMT7_9PEZI|nr:hypothetical protein H2201_006203 [Coniosporium apollinis]